MLSCTFRTIGQLHGSVAVKVDRGGVTKAAQSRTDVGDIKTVSDAISSILEVFDVRSIIINRANLSDISAVRNRSCSRETSG